MRRPRRQSRRGFLISKSVYEQQDAAEREILADFVADTIFRGEEAVRELVAVMEPPEKVHFLRRLVNWITGLWKKVRRVNRDVDNELLALRRDFESLLRESRKEEGKTEERERNKNPAKYTFKGYDKKTGKGIYESNFPLGTHKAEKGRRILSFIENVWSKKPISLRITEADGTEKTIQAQFDPFYDESENTLTDASKLMGGNRHGTASEKRVTLDLADDYYQIASEATYNYSKEETGKSSVTHQGVKQWHYFINDILFQEYGQEETTPYRVTINVKEKNDGNFVYSFNAEKAEGETASYSAGNNGGIKKEGDSTRRTLHADVNDDSETVIANAIPSIDSIPDGGENVNEKSSGVQYSLSKDEVEAVQGVGRKSINQFSPDEIRVTETFARQYWKEMGTKSPFFRAWFGDWRMYDTTPIQIATQKGNSRGVTRNEDTGWDIQVSGKVFAESQHFADKNASALPYLPYINDIVEKAVLLDSHGIDKKKSPNSLLMHSLYAIADINNGPEVLKLYVEEMNDPNKLNTAKRAYQLQNIEKASTVIGGVQRVSLSSLANTADAIDTISDLAAYVKSKDSAYQPNPVDQAVLNDDGTPKVFYHGTNEQFTEYDLEMNVHQEWGEGIYLTSDKRVARAYGDIIMPFYVKATMNNRTAKKTGQPKDHIAFKNGNILVFSPTQIKSATDNIGTFDGSNPDIRYSLSEAEAEELIAQYNAGNISDEQLKAHLTRQKRPNPVEIAAKGITADGGEMPHLEPLEPSYHGNKERQHYEKAMENDEYAEEVKDIMRENASFKNYGGISNQKMLELAKRQIDEGGERFIREWMAKDIREGVGEGSALDDFFE